MVMPEEVAARLLADAVYYRTTLRIVARDFFSMNPQLDYLKPVVRVLTLNVARNYLLLDRILESLGYGPPSHSYRWMLARVLVYEAVLGKLKRSRVEKLAPKAGVKAEDIIALKQRGAKPKDFVRGLGGLDRLSILYSFPRWILEELAEAEHENLPKLLEALNQDPTRWIRVAPWVDRRALEKKLKGEGVIIKWDGDLNDVAMVVEGDDRLTQTRAYEEGLYTVQDKASVLVSHVAKPQGLVVGDVTCGAAVKASHMAWLGARYVLGGDVKARRLEEAKQLIRRLKVDHLIDLFVGDARQPPLRKLQVYLVDPPCTDIGRLQYEPEVKMWLTRGDLKVYQRIQKRILKSILESAPRGSTIVYSVCTLTASETIKVVKSVVREVGEAEIVRAEPMLGVKVKKLPEAQWMLPHIHKTQGFFIAKIVKL
ncbi:MAG TPA: RsmB/NOP family class I SAM-dependent RNA methyltransferase [Pyrodictium sp.]|nr:RsmB/NOP family class I SAM-dependent RNA methyltransferase [Pyrodictium sp.]